MKKIMASFIRKALHKKLKKKIVTLLSEDADLKSDATLIEPSYYIPETGSIHCRRSEVSGSRLNLLLPALSIRYAFGGINTAIDFFLKLLDESEDARIIITDEVTSDLLALPNIEAWNLTSMDNEDKPGKWIICTGDRSSHTIPVRKNDIFVATAWWTAYISESILRWQEQQWRQPPSSLVYLIQDFEPGFYKWSSRYVMCLSTYKQPNLIAVINTKLLRDFFESNGISFQQCYIFEPSLNKILAKYLQRLDLTIKQKKILFYGRPSVDRNAFEIVLNGIKLWSEHYPDAKNWKIISLGESYLAPILANGSCIEVKGKMSLEEYAELLLNAAIGVSFMISPHPSYPPLEMAAFELGVITNTFYNKNLSEYHKNIYSLDVINPDNLARLLYDLCKKFEADTEVFKNSSFQNLDFTKEKSSYDFIPQLRSHLNIVRGAKTNS